MRFRTTALISTLVLLAACGKDSTTAPAVTGPSGNFRGTFVGSNREESWSSSSLPRVRPQLPARSLSPAARRQSHRNLHSVLERGESHWHGLRRHRNLHVIVQPVLGRLHRPIRRSRQLGGLKAELSKSSAAVTNGNAAGSWESRSQRRPDSYGVFAQTSSGAIDLVGTYNSGTGAITITSPDDGTIGAAAP